MQIKIENFAYPIVHKVTARQNARSPLSSLPPGGRWRYTLRNGTVQRNALTCDGESNCADDEQQVGALVAEPGTENHDCVYRSVHEPLLYSIGSVGLVRWYCYTTVAAVHSRLPVRSRRIRHTVGLGVRRHDIFSQDWSARAVQAFEPMCVLRRLSGKWKQNKKSKMIINNVAYTTTDECIHDLLQTHHIIHMTFVFKCEKHTWSSWNNRVDRSRVGAKVGLIAQR